jgi:hypothetical protein
VAGGYAYPALDPDYPAGLMIQSCQGSLATGMSMLVCALIRVGIGFEPRQLGDFFCPTTRRYCFRFPSLTGLGTHLPTSRAIWRRFSCEFFPLVEDFSSGSCRPSRRAALRPRGTTGEGGSSVYRRALGQIAQKSASTLRRQSDSKSCCLNSKSLAPVE